MSKESRLLKNTAIIAIGNVCTKCISFFLLPFYTSILTTQEYGTVDLISTVSMLFIILLTLQVEQGLFRFLIESRNDKEKQISYITTTICFMCIFNIVCVTVLTVVLRLMHYQYTTYLVTWVVIGIANAILLQIPRGLGLNTVYAVASFWCGSSNVILNVIFIAILDLGVNGMLAANILSLVISSIYLFVKLKMVNYIKISYIEKDCLKEILVYSFPLVPNTLCWWVVNVSDRLIIKICINTAATGIYSVACKFPSIFSMVSNIFQLAWIESASENVNDEDKNIYYNKIMNNTMKFYSSCCMGIIAILPLFFDLLIKKEFIEAYYYIPILMLGALVHSVADLYGALYAAYKMTNRITKTTILSAGANIVVNLLFIKHIGLYAAAISTLFAYCLIALIRHYEIKNIISILIPKKYLLVEITMYALVLGGYYYQHYIVQIVMLVLVIPYCIYQNREVVKGLMCKVFGRTTS